MKNHYSLPLDEGTIEEIAANLDLRVPNVRGLTAIAQRFDQADGEPFEAVLDMATAVGKTYIAAGIIDYVAAGGVRNIAIITPSRAILNKTIANFSTGTAKSIPGRTTSPLIITSDTFDRGDVAAALADDSVVKLFIFTVQQLIKPKEKASRRVRDFHEGIGQGLYEYLQAVGDLVVLADEHHAYYGPEFSKAIRELDAVALIGLTATPNPKTPDAEFAYRYTLGEAIADGIVKTPVLVGRKDDRKELEVQLADAMELLRNKREAVSQWCQTTGRTPINPVMFIVCQTIDDATEVAEILRRPNFFGPEYENAVLEVHSEAADDALERLDQVEDPSSPVRAIVSVNQLKEGWDVKNIYVICALRALASRVLTEQTLGRGLRLPFGELTGHEMLDTVEVLGHDRYEDLLRNASALIKRLVGQRTAPVAVDPSSGVAEENTVEDEVVEPAPATTSTATGDGPAVLPTTLPGVSGPVIRVADVEARKREVERENLSMKSVIHINPTMGSFAVPVVHRTFAPGQFSLSQVKNEDFELIGRSLAANPEDVLRRNKLEVVQTPEGALEVRPVAAADVVKASILTLDLGQGKEALVEATMNLGLVKQSASELNAAKRLVDAFVKGLGDEAEKRLSAFFSTALDAIEQTLRARYRSVPGAEQITVTERFLEVERLNSRPTTSNLYQKVDKSSPAAYEGWQRSMVSVEWFDSDPERQMAVLLDQATSHIKRWVRLHRGDGVVISFRGQNYYPDFAAEHVDGSYWLIEVKADNEMDDALVQQKKEMAEEWARFASDSSDVAHEWHYALIGETQLNNAHGNWDLLIAQAGAK